MSGQITVTVDVDVGMDDFDDEDLIAELESRGYTITKQTAYDAAAEAAYIAARPMLDALPDPVRNFILDQCGRVC